jgi:hypothetical protein
VISKENEIYWYSTLDDFLTSFFSFPCRNLPFSFVKFESESVFLCVGRCGWFVSVFSKETDVPNRNVEYSGATTAISFDVSQQAFDTDERVDGGHRKIRFEFIRVKNSTNWKN